MRCPVLLSDGPSLIKFALLELVKLFRCGGIDSEAAADQRRSSFYSLIPAAIYTEYSDSENYPLDGRFWVSGGRTAAFGTADETGIQENFPMVGHGREVEELREYIYCLAG